MNILLIIVILLLLTILIFINNYKSNTIPNVIYQTYMDKTRIPKKVYDNIKKYASKYKHIIYNDIECKQFIKHYFGLKVVKRFKGLKGAHKADLFRYCLLYIKGGIYLDIKTQLITPIEKIFTKNNTMYTVLAKGPKQVYQGVIATPKGNPIFLKLIEFMMNINLHDLRTKKTYLIFTIDMYRNINKLTHGTHLRQGYNKSKNKGIDYYLFQEKCSKNSLECSDGLDRYGYCCYINNNNKKIIKTRYSDFPW